MIARPTIDKRAAPPLDDWRRNLVAMAQPLDPEIQRQRGLRFCNFHILTSLCVLSRKYISLADNNSSYGVRLKKCNTEIYVVQCVCARDRGGDAT